MSDRQRILFVTSNGTGLGHLTRSMAIARRLDPAFEPLFFTLSAAAAVARELGFAVEYMASHTSPGAGNDWRWERRLGPRLEAAIAEIEPRALLFDGILPWDPLLKAIRPVPVAVWCRRGLWRPGASAVPLRRAGRFDAVLEPGELAAGEDRGPTAAERDRAHRVAPIVFCDDAELLPRAEAERELGLREGMTNVVVQLGQGPEVAGAAERSLRALAGRDGVQVAAISSLIEGLPEVPEGIVHLGATFPMSRYYAAFDGAVSAAGYNSFHELTRFGVPSLFVPMPRETDDQAARARHAQATGLGLGIAGPDDPSLERQLEALLDSERREAIRGRLNEQRPADGAAEAARWLEGLVGELQVGGAPGSGRGGDGRGGAEAQVALGARLRSGVTWLASVPRTLARLGGQVIAQPRLRTLVVALGVPEGDLERRVSDAFSQIADPPQRVLVVTDSIRIGPLRSLGVAVEHVPAPGERQPELAGGDYESFLRRRLGLILAQRPRLRRAIAIGEVPPGLLDAATSPPRRRARLLR